MNQQEEHRSRRSRCLSIRRSETSLIKDEFDSLRARFDAEMRQMEADMARFRSQMESLSGTNSTKADSSNQTTTTTSTKSTRKTTTTSSTRGQLVNCDATHIDWLNEFAQSPIVVSSTGEGGEQGRSLKLRFDVSAYKPEEIVVKTSEDRLQVEARHEQTTEEEFVSREYNREFLLPVGVDHDQIKSTLSLEGILTVEVPLGGSRPAPPGGTTSSSNAP